MKKVDAKSRCINLERFKKLMLRLTFGNAQHQDEWELIVGQRKSFQ